MEEESETRWDYIRDGDKIYVLSLKDNPWDYTSVAMRVDETHVPDWFKELPFDDMKHEQKLIDKKLDNVIGSILGWTFEPISDYREEVFEEFDFLAHL